MRASFARWIASALRVAVFTLALPAFAQSNPTGGVHGRVMNQKTGSYLQGARIQVAGTNITTLSDVGGQFSLEGLPAGPVTLQAFYTGLDTAAISADVRPGQQVLVDIPLVSSIQQLEAYQVSELREGNAAAMMQQRYAPNVKDALATDAFGSLRDGNVAELLVLVPGVVGDYIGNDIMTVSVRGFSPNLGSVTVDGAKVANAESGATDRMFEWEATAADNIETVEVIKAPTPDMEADSIGGTINLKTKSAFNSSDARRTSISAGIAYESLHDSVLPNANFSHTQVIGAKRNIGLSFNWGYSQHAVIQNGTQMTYASSTAIPNPIQSLQMYDQWNVRERNGGGLKLDYKLSEQSTFYFNTMYGYFREQAIRGARTRRVRVTTNAASMAPGASDDFGVWLPTNNTTAIQQVESFPKQKQNIQFAAGGKNRLSGWRVDYDVTYSFAKSWYDSAGGKGGGIEPILRNVGLTVDRRNTSRYFPTLTQNSGPNIYDIASYSANTTPFIQRQRQGNDDVFTAGGNFEKPFAASIPLTLKFGVKYRTQDRVSWIRDHRYTYLGPDGIAANGDETLARFADSYQSNYLGDGHYGVSRWLNIRALAEARAAQPGWFLEDLVFAETQRLQNDRHIKESVGAAYAMGTLKLGKLSVLAGLRYEATKVEGEGALRQVTPAEAARRAAFVGAVTIDESLRRIRAEFSRKSAEADYEYLFPGLHLRYEPVRNLQFRASYSTSIGRPNFGAIIPDTNANFDTRIVTTNNTGLKPQYGQGIDGMVQYYFEPIGTVSAGVFYKKIEDYIFTNPTTIGSGAGNGFDGDYAGFDLRSQSNGGSATIKGVELNYIQQLAFLPGLFRNLTVNANYTLLRTRGSYGGAPNQPTTKLEGFVPEAANVGIAFFSRGLDIRVKGTYKGEFLFTNAATVAGLRYKESRFNTDLNVSYKFSQRYTVFFDWVNMFNTYDPDYQYRRELVRTYIPAGSRINAGVRARF
ncbi:MAG TPA: TonB-dependent receptor [Opitutaceae bacterium]|nr:TonB-dependent receptor [Opitutaceae bacterium]